MLPLDLDPLYRDLIIKLEKSIWNPEDKVGEVNHKGWVKEVNNFIEGREIIYDNLFSKISLKEIKPDIDPDTKNPRLNPIGGNYNLVIHNEDNKVLNFLASYKKLVKSKHEEFTILKSLILSALNNLESQAQYQLFINYGNPFINDEEQSLNKEEMNKQNSLSLSFPLPEYRMFRLFIYNKAPLKKDKGKEKVDK